MSRPYLYLLLLLMTVVFMDGLVHISIVAPWFAACIIVAFTYGAILLARDELKYRGHIEK